MRMATDVEPGKNRGVQRKLCSPRAEDRNENRNEVSQEELWTLEDPLHRDRRWAAQDFDSDLTLAMTALLQKHLFLETANPPNKKVREETQ